MNTVTVLSGLGQTPYAIVAAQRARFSSQARQRANVGYNIRNWRRISGGNTNRQRIAAARLRMARERRARQTELPQPPDPMEMAAERRRREEATKRTSARLSRMMAPTFRPGSGQRTLIRTVSGRPVMSAWTRRIEDEKIRQRARALARTQRESEVRRLVAGAKAEGLRRSAAQVRAFVPPPIETTPSIETAPVIQIPDRVPVMITARETPETLDIARREPAIRQSTEALQRLVTARRALGIR